MSEGIERSPDSAHGSTPASLELVDVVEGLHFKDEGAAKVFLLRAMAELINEGVSEADAAKVTERFPEFVYHDNNGDLWVNYKIDGESHPVKLPPPGPDTWQWKH